MELYKAVLEIKELLVDRDVVLPSHPYDARDLEDALEEFLDRFFYDAYSEGKDDGYDMGQEDGYRVAQSTDF
jgi:hypothetical protein